MSIKVRALVLGATLYPKKSKKDRLRLSKKFVLSVMADHAHDDGREARPGMRLLADECGFEDVRQAQRVTHALVAEEWLLPDRAATFTQPASYRVNLPKLRAVQREKKPRRGVTPASPGVVTPTAPRPGGGVTRVSPKPSVEEEPSGQPSSRTSKNPEQKASPSSSTASGPADLTPVIIPALPVKDGTLWVNAPAVSDIWFRVRTFKGTLTRVERDWVKGQTDYRVKGSRTEWSQKERTMLTQIYMQRVAEGYPITPEPAPVPLTPRDRLVNALRDAERETKRYAAWCAKNPATNETGRSLQEQAKARRDAKTEAARKALADYDAEQPS